MCVRTCLVMSDSLWPHGLYSQVNRILQARILEWVAIPFSGVSSQSRDQTQVSHIAGGFFTIWATRETWRFSPAISLMWSLTVLFPPVLGLHEHTWPLLAKVFGPILFGSPWETAAFDRVLWADVTMTPLQPCCGQTPLLIHKKHAFLCQQLRPCRPLPASPPHSEVQHRFLPVEASGEARQQSAVSLTLQRTLVSLLEQFLWHPSQLISGGRKHITCQREGTGSPVHRQCS